MTQANKNKLEVPLISASARHSFAIDSAGRTQKKAQECSCSSKIRAFNGRVRESIFGIELHRAANSSWQEHDSPAHEYAKIKHTQKFSNWSWWVFLTPWLRGTVFSRLGLHIQVWIYIAFGQVVYFAWLKEADCFKKACISNNIEAAKHYNDLLKQWQSYMSFLVAWLLSTFLNKVHQVYFESVQQKANALAKQSLSLCMMVSISMSRDPAIHEAVKSIESEIRDAVEATALYSLACSVANCDANANRNKTKFWKEKMIQIFDERGLDGNTICSIGDSEDVLDSLTSALFRTIMEEDKRGLMNVPHNTRIMDSVGTFRASCLDMIRSLSLDRHLSFSYMQLIFAATKVAQIFHVFFAYLYAAMEHANRKEGLPFTCFQTAFNRDGSNIQTCPTEQYIRFNATMLLYLYIILGCLEMFPFLTSRFWTACQDPRRYEKDIKAAVNATNQLDHHSLGSLRLDETENVPSPSGSFCSNA